MIRFSGYEDYCKAFSDEESCLAAELVYYSRCRLADICALADEGENYLGTDGFTLGEFAAGGRDILSDIIREVSDAVLYISRNLRERILREDTLIPIYQVKEITSAGMNWISRRNGRTIREKLSDCNSIMGVNRRLSVDTGENRLFIAFLKRLVELIEFKTTMLPSELLREDEEELMEQLFVFLKSEQVAEIRRWENLPPNNTLLSDRHYRCIWHGWTRLQELDEMMAADMERLDTNLSTVLFWSLFRVISAICCFPQTPVIVDYNSFSVEPCGGQLRGVRADGSELSMRMSGNQSYICVDGVVNTITLTDMHLSLECNGEAIYSADLTPESFDRIVQKLAKKLGVTGKRMPKRSEDVDVADLYVDIFSDAPYYITDEGNAARLGMRPAAAVYACEGNEDMMLPVMSSVSYRTDIVKKFITPLSCVLQSNESKKRDSGDAYTLLSMFSDRVKAKCMHFIFPDVVDEFRLSPIRRAARMFYNNIDAVPQSIGAVFAFEGSDYFDQFYNNVDMILVADVVGNELTLTPLRGAIHDDLDGLVEGRRSIIWERYPTASYTIFDGQQDFSDAPEIQKLCLGGLSQRNRNDPVLDHDGWHRLSDYSAYDRSVCIDGYIRKYISEHKRILGKSRIMILALDDRLGSDDNKYPMLTFPVYCCIQGHYRCNWFTQQTGTTLWKDHLPDLSFRQPLSIFDLVKGQTVVPDSQEITIKISNHFTLPAGKDFYSFELVQEDANSKLNRHAVLRHKSFPLREDVECRLVMKYKYGEDDPYTLTFTPIDRETAGFNEIVVQWEEGSDYTYSDKVWPVFPEPYSINELRHFQPNNTDIIGWVITTLDSLSVDWYSCQLDSDDWKADKNNCYFVDIMLELDGTEQSVRLYDNKKNTLRNADVVYFTVYYNKNKARYPYQVDITADSLEELRRRVNKNKRSHLIKSVLFPLHTMHAGGRTLDSNECPDEFRRTVRENIGRIRDMYTELDDRFGNLSHEEYDEYKKMLTLMSLLYSFQDSDFYSRIINKTDRYINRLVDKIHPSIGFAIGPCETEDQKRLFCKIVELCRVDPGKGINLLSRSVWKHPDMIHNADSSMMLECFDKAVYQLEKYAALCEKDIVAAADRVQNYCIVPCLELALAMFRLRESGDESICSRLRYASVMNRKLRESLDKINKLRNSEITEVINGSRVNMELSGNTENMPPLLYALMLYSWGDLAGDQIKITAIND